MGRNIRASLFPSGGVVKGPLSFLPPVPRPTIGFLQMWAEIKAFRGTAIFFTNDRLGGPGPPVKRIEIFVTKSGPSIGP